jgi:DNA excision repair protein ERCC-5
MKHQNCSNYSEESDTEVTTAKVESLCDYIYGKDVHSIDITSEQFKSLPPEIRHEVLSELIETRKQSSWGRLQEMKTVRKFKTCSMLILYFTGIKLVILEFRSLLPFL